MKSILIKIVVPLVALSLILPLQGQRKIKLKKSSGNSSTSTTDDGKDLSTNIKRRSSSNLGKKDLWLAVGLSLSVPGAGHFYIGKYSSAAISFVGSYGLLFGGIAAMLTAHSTTDVIVDGTFVREEDDTNKPLFILGSIFLASGIIFYLGSVIDIFIDVSEHNRRVDRLRRYNRKRSEIRTELYLAQARGSYYLGQTYRF